MTVTQDRAIDVQITRLRRVRANLKAALPSNRARAGYMLVNDW